MSDASSGGSSHIETGTSDCNVPPSCIHGTSEVGRDHIYDSTGKSNTKGGRLQFYLGKSVLCQIR